MPKIRAQQTVSGVVPLEIFQSRPLRCLVYSSRVAKSPWRQISECDHNSKGSFLEMERSKRETVNTQSAVLAKLREAKRAGKRQSELLEFRDEGDVYEELPEDQYKEIVEQRRQLGDFIEDDGIADYVDDGEEEDWDVDNFELEDEEYFEQLEAIRAEKMSVQSRVSRIRKLKDIQPRRVDSKFLTQRRATASRDENLNPQRMRNRKGELGDDKLNALLEQLDEDQDFEQNVSEQTKTEDIALFGQTSQVENAANMLAAKMHDVHFDHSSTPSMAVKAEYTRDDVPIGTLEGSEEEHPSKKPKYETVVSSEEMTTIQAASSAPLPNFSTLKEEAPQVPLKVEAGESLQMFWLDAFEDQERHPGSIFLFGKVPSEASGQYISCCVKIQNMERNLFFLPRKTTKNSNIIPGTHI